MTFWLRRWMEAVAHARRPHGPVLVRDHLHLDVAGVGDQALDEHDRVAEGPLCLALGALEGQLQLVLGVDLADAAAAAAAARLDDQRVADGLGVTAGVRARVDGAAAPRGDGDADLLGEQLGLDLVAEELHRLRRRADERDAHGPDQLGEGRVLGDEAPAHPDGVGPAAAQRVGEGLVVQVGVAGAGGADADGVVRLADEHRAALGVGVHGDRLDAVTVLGVELAHGADEAYCRLASVHYRNPLEHRRHLNHRSRRRPVLVPHGGCAVPVPVGVPRRVPQDRLRARRWPHPRRSARSRHCRGSARRRRRIGPRRGPGRAREPVRPGTAMRPDRAAGAGDHINNAHSRGACHI